MRNKKFKSFLSGCAAILFTLNAVIPSGFPAASEAPSLSGETLINNLPAGIAHVESIVKGTAPEKPFVIYIQDAHANPEAQESIRKILQAIHAQTGSDKLTVAFEGAVGELHPEYLRFFKDYPAADEAIRRDLASKGELTGTELFASGLYEDKKFDSGMIQGIEDAGLYRENFSAYEAAAETGTLNQKRLNALKDDLAKAWTKNAGPDLLKFNRERARRKHGEYGRSLRSFGQASDKTHAALSAYADYLAKCASDWVGIDLSREIEELRFPNLIRLLKLKTQAGSVNIETAQRDWTGLQNDFASVLGIQEAGSLQARVLRGEKAGKNEKQVRQFLEEIAAKSPDLFTQIRSRESLWKMLVRSLLLEEMDAEALFAEMSVLEQAIESKLAVTGEEKFLITLSRDFELLQKLLYLELTSEDWQVLQTTPEAVDMDSLLRRLHLLGIKNNPESFSLLQWNVQSALRFYETAETRDRALFSNALTAAQKRGAQVLVLIAGGFHAQGFIQALDKNRSGYAVMRPVIRSASDASQYHRVMMRKNVQSYGTEKMQIASKQTALLLQALSDTGMPVIEKTASLTDAQQIQVFMQAIQAHPLLKGALQFEAADGSALQEMAFTVPGVVYAANFALGERALTQSNPTYTSLLAQDRFIESARGGIRFFPGIANGRLALRSEVRINDADYPLTPEKKWRRRETKSEDLYVGAYRRKLAEITKAGGDSEKVLNEQVYKRGSLQIGEIPGSSFFATQQSLDAMQRQVSSLNPDDPRLEARKSTRDGILTKASIVADAESEGYKQKGKALIGRGMHRMIALAGGMSVRGAIYANEFIYLPGYGKVPLLALKILNVLHAGQQVGNFQPLFTVAESDFTIPKVREAVEWLVARKLLPSDQDLDYFTASIVPRLTLDGKFYRPDNPEEYRQQGFANASHFDAIRYYILSGLWGEDLKRVQKAGAQDKAFVISFSNMNVPTSTLSAELVGHLAAASQENAATGVLIEMTDNRGEEGGFFAQVDYGNGLIIDQSVERYLMTPGQLDLVKADKKNFPLFNTNALHVTHQFLEDFFNLDKLGFIPDKEALKDEDKFLELLAALDAKTSIFGDDAPGEKIATYPEFKTVEMTTREGKKKEVRVLQLSRLLSDIYRVASFQGRGMAYYVPREMDRFTDSETNETVVTHDRYTEAKTYDNIVNNRKAFQAALADQLSLLPAADQPLSSADTLVESLDRFYQIRMEKVSRSLARSKEALRAHQEELELLMESMETADLTGRAELELQIAEVQRKIVEENGVVETVQEIKNAVVELHKTMIRALDSRNAGQHAAFADLLKHYPDTSARVTRLNYLRQATEVVRSPGAKSEVRLARSEAVTTTQQAERELTDEVRGLSADSRANLPPVPSERITVASALGVIPPSAGVDQSSRLANASAMSLIEGTEANLPAFTLAEKAALGEEFLQAFFDPARAVLYRQNDQLLLQENLEKLPAFDSGMKLWVRYLAIHRNVTWGVDGDRIEKTALDLFRAKLFEMAEAWGTPLADNQVLLVDSKRPGFEISMLRLPLKNQLLGYLARQEDVLTTTLAVKGASFHRTHEGRALDRMIAAEALRNQIPDDLQSVIGPLSELAAAVFKTSYSALEAGFAAYQRLAASA